MHWQAQNVVVVYSTLVVDKLIGGCFFETHDTTPVLIINTTL